MNTSLTRKPALIVATAVAALALAACGSSDTTDTASGASLMTSSSPSAMGSMDATASPSHGPPASGPHNAQDVTFVKDMLPHHSQAVEMADIALTRDTTPKVKALAQQVKDAQAPEISAMGGWLTGWGEQVPAAESMGGHSSLSGGMSTGGTGMMGADQMTALDKATGTEFAKMWLTDMTEHHTGAVAMARVETIGGQSADAKKLATSIISSQTAEIATMKQLLAGLA